MSNDDGGHFSEPDRQAVTQAMVDAAMAVLTAELQQEPTGECYLSEVRAVMPAALSAALAAMSEALSIGREGEVEMWKPIREYPCTPGEQGPLVLARLKDKTPVLVVMRDGHFVVCPAVPVFYGDRQMGVMHADHVVEFMEIPN